MLVPNRHGSSSAYRYGFQGQEKDDELKGEGNSLNYTFRMHDPRVGRFFAVDPLEKKYPWYTPYQFSGNKVIQYVELEGLEEGNTNTGSSGALDLNQGGAFATPSLIDYLREPDIYLPEITVTFSKPRQYTGYTADVDPYASTQTKEEYIAEYGYDTYINYSSADRARYIKERTRDKWTPEQADAFHSSYQKGNAATNGYTDPLVGILAIGVAPVPIAMFGAPVIGELGTQYGLFSFSTKGAGLRMLNETATEYFANGEVGKINWVAVGASSFKLNLASDYLGSQFSYTINKGMEFNTFNKMGANFGVTQANRILGIGATKISSQPFFNNTMDKITTHGLSIGFQSFLKYQTNEIE